MKVELSKLEIWFIEKAIELKDAVLPLDSETLSDEEFKNDYGYTKEQVNFTVNNLRKKINQYSISNG